MPTYNPQDDALALAGRRVPQHVLDRLNARRIALGMVAFLENRGLHDAARNYFAEHVRPLDAWLAARGIGIA